ncbi:CAP-Gly domain-containing linker protein 1-like isoform X1 [Eleutherodactylus coqui]|uniref:CAP-Gly domain-containing linker protein 1-like isoform X1 n=1 Tax=Eleutherodactylus coqui TaxID=57060 RepID=UPI00346324B9
METLRNVFHRREHPSWRKLCDAWTKLTHSAFFLNREHSSLEYKEWNPWKDWCKSWEEINYSLDKTPKSEMSRANLFFELSILAKLTRDKLEEAKTTAQENQSLIKQNFALQKKCDELQSQLYAEKQMRLENDSLIKYNLEKEVQLKKTLEVQKEFFASEVKKKEELEQALTKCNELVNTLKYNLEKEVQLKKTLEVQKEFFASQVKKKEEELEQALTKCNKLVNTLSDYGSQLAKYDPRISYQVNIQNDIIVTGPKASSSLPQLKNGEEERGLDSDSLKETVDWLGKVHSLNVFDWLYRFEEQYIVSVWSRKDREQILRGCLDPSVFTLVLPVLKMDHTIWLDIRKCIVESFIPELDNLLKNEKMREDDTVLQYFQRMWMIYRFTECYSYPSKDDPEYIKAILEGLLPHLYERVEHYFESDYESTEHAVRSAEYSWLQSENKRQNWYEMTLKAGPGCPSRRSIWKRLEKYLYAVPYEEINGAPYWKLLAYLSRYEDL